MDGGLVVWIFLVCSTVAAIWHAVSPDDEKERKVKMQVKDDDIGDLDLVTWTCDDWMETGANDVDAPEDPFEED